MRKSLFFTTIAALGLAAGAAAAAEGRGKLSFDDDGYIDLSQLDERRAARLAAADTNGDGRVSKEELKAHMQNRRGEHRARMLGGDGSGPVTRADYDAAMAERFSKLDADGDGVLSEEELRAGRRGGGKHGKRSRD